MTDTTQTTPMNSLHGNSIPNGTKFVAFFGDGSGAKLFLISDDGELADAENGFRGITAPEVWLQDAGFIYWMKLPDSFKLWFEECEEKIP